MGTFIFSFPLLHLSFFLSLFFIYFLHFFLHTSFKKKFRYHIGNSNIQGILIQEQAGTDRNRQEQTGADRNRQELLHCKEIHISDRKSRSKAQTGTDRNRQEQTGVDRIIYLI